MIAGAAKYMDLIDGGTWRLDDDSMPNLKRIYIGGTHTRNPLKLAAARAALTEMKKRCSGSLECRTCSCFQKELNSTTRGMAERLNAFFQERNVPVRADHFSSLFKFRFLDSPFGVVRELFLVLLRMHGVETSVSGNFFLTTAHDATHVAAIVQAAKDSIDALLAAGVTNVLLGGMTDLPAVTACYEAGVGATIPLSIGATQQFTAVGYDASGEAIELVDTSSFTAITAAFACRCKSKSGSRRCSSCADGSGATRYRKRKAL